MFKELNIYINDELHKKIKFKEGLNIILADTDTPEKYDNKTTRNSVGKSLTLEIINYCLFSNVGSRLKQLLEESTKKFSFELIHTNFTHKRDLKKGKKCGDFLFNNIEVDNPENSLRNLFWGINDNSISFRDMMRYFFRYENEHFNDFYEKTGSKTIDLEFKLSYLFQINSDTINKLYRYMIDKNSYKDFYTTINSKIAREFPNLSGGELKDTNELRKNKQKLENELKDLEENISSINVIDAYKDMEDKSNKITKEIHELSQEILYLKDKLNILKQASNKDKTVILGIDELENIYENCGVIFDQNAIKSIREVENFHNLLEKDTKNILEKQIIEIEKNIIFDENKRDKLINERHEFKSILDKGTSNEEYEQIRKEIADKKSKYSLIDKTIKEIEELEKKVKDSKKIIDEAKTILKTEIDNNEIVKNIQQKFVNNSKYLYNEYGTCLLSKSTKETHIFEFEADIQGGNGDGKTKMQYYCFDMMIMELWDDRKDCLCKLLVHDNKIFDGVDEKQVLKAIELGKSKATKLGFQYIITLNSFEAVYSSLLNKKIIDNKDIILTIKDDPEEELLLGFKF
jgi:uncharacterized protein YydD (DUF2326 family)